MPVIPSARISHLSRLKPLAYPDHHLDSSETGVSYPSERSSLCPSLSQLTPADFRRGQEDHRYPTCFRFRGEKKAFADCVYPTTSPRHLGRSTDETSGASTGTPSRPDIALILGNRPFLVHVGRLVCPCQAGSQRAEDIMPIPDAITREHVLTAMAFRKNRDCFSRRCDAARYAVGSPRFPQP